MNATDKTVTYGKTGSKDGVRHSRPFTDKRIGLFHERLKNIIEKSSIRGFSRKCGLSEGALRGYLKGDSFPSLDKIDAISCAAGVSAEWLVTGEEPNAWMAHEKPEHKDIDIQLQEIEDQLQELDSPFSPDRVTKDGVIYNIQQQLSNISGMATATQVQRARADKMLELAFDDAAAIQKGDQRLKDTGSRMRHSRQAFDEILAAMDWTPPLLIQEAVKTSIYNGLSNDGAVTLLNMLRLQFEDDNKK